MEMIENGDRKLNTLILNHLYSSYSPEIHIVMFENMILLVLRSAN